MNDSVTNEMLSKAMEETRSSLAEMVDPQSFVDYCLLKLKTEGRLPVNTVVVIPADWGVKQ